MKRKILTVICTAALLVSMSAYCAYGSDVTVTVNGEVIEFDVQPQIVEGRVMVPVRAIFEAVGADVQWDFKTQTVTGSKDGTVVKMTVGSSILYLNDAPIYMDCAPMELDHRVLTPARYVVESYGYVVTWDEVGSTVKIMSMDDYQTQLDNNAAQSEPEKKGVFARFADWIKGLFG